MKRTSIILILALSLNSCQNDRVVTLSRHENGQPYQVLKLDYGVKNEYTGTETIFRDDGSIHCKGSLEKGIRNGNWTCFYKNGDVEWSGVFKNGVEHGTFKCNYPDGTWRIFNVHEGIYSGQTIEFNLDDEGDNFYVQGQYANDKETGRWVWKDVDGDVMMERNYLNGELKGDMKTFYKNGNIRSKSKCIEGRGDTIIVTDTIFYYNKNIAGKIDRIKIVPDSPPPVK